MVQQHHRADQKTMVAGARAKLSVVAVMMPMKGWRGVSRAKMSCVVYLAICTSRHVLSLISQHVNLAERLASYVKR